MHTQELLEYSVPSRITRYFRDYTAVPEWGGVLQRVVDNCEAMGGRKGAEYGASMMASRMREPEVLVNINNKAVFISSERKNNKPTITKLDELDNYEERLNDLSYKMLLPPYWAATWIRQEPEGSILHTVGQKQEDRRRLPIVSAAPQAKITSNGDIDSGGEEISVATNDGGEIIGQVDLPKFGTTGPAATFADSGKQGIANNPEEEEAILEIQTFLSDTLGLDVGRNGPDKIYGPRTVKAVKILQQAINKIGDNSIKVDGDAGPMTISGMLAINQDFEKIAKLTKELDSNKTESFVKIVYKSRIAQLLEQTLIEAPRGELETLIAKYKDLLDSNILPDDAPIKAIVKNAKAKMVALDTVTALDVGISGSNSGEIAAQQKKVDDAQAELDRINNDLVKTINTPVVSTEVEPEVEVDPDRPGGDNNPFKNQTDRYAWINAGRPDIWPPEAEAETLPASDWEDITKGSAMINGYSLFRNKLDGNWGYTFAITGEKPSDDAESYNVIAYAIAGARMHRDQAAEKQKADDLVKARLAAEKEKKRQDALKLAAPLRAIEADKAAAAEKGKKLHDILDSGFLGYTNTAKQQAIISIIKTIRSREGFNIANTAFKKAAAKSGNEGILTWLKLESWDTTPIFTHVNSLNNSTVTDSVIHTLSRINTVLGVKQ